MFFINHGTTRQGQLKIWLPPLWNISCLHYASLLRPWNDSWMGKCINGSGRSTLTTPPPHILNPSTYSSTPHVWISIIIYGGIDWSDHIHPCICYVLINGLKLLRPALSNGVLMSRRRSRRQRRRTTYPWMESLNMSSRRHVQIIPPSRALRSTKTCTNRILCMHACFHASISS